MPYMRRIPRRPAFPDRMSATWILAVCPLHSTSEIAGSQPHGRGALAVTAADDRTVGEIPGPKTPSAPEKPMSIRALDRTKNTAGQVPRKVLDVTRLLATNTSRATGGPAKRRIFSSGDRDGMAEG